MTAGEAFVGDGAEPLMAEPPIYDEATLLNTDRGGETRGGNVLGLAIGVGVLATTALLLGRKKWEEVTARHQRALSERQAAMRAAGKTDAEIEQVTQQMGSEAVRIADEALAKDDD